MNIDNYFDHLLEMQDKKEVEYMDTPSLYCDWCNGPIYPGDSYYKHDESYENICEECMDSFKGHIAE